MKPRVASLGRVAYLSGTSWDLAPARVTGQQGTAARSPRKGGRPRGRPGSAATGRSPHPPVPRSPPDPLPCGATPRRRPARHRRCPDTGADLKGPAPRPESRARGPFHAAGDPPPRDVTRVTRRSCATATTNRGDRRSSMQQHQSWRGAALGGGCSALSCERTRSNGLNRTGSAGRAQLDGQPNGLSPSSAGPPASPGTAAAGRRRPRTGRRGTSARPPRAVRTPPPAAAAGPPRPCSARRTWRAPPGP